MVITALPDRLNCGRSSLSGTGARHSALTFRVLRGILTVLQPCGVSENFSLRRPR